jgi:DNA-binding transcriptional regulator YiaG
MAEDVKHLRKLAGLTQKQFSARLSIPLRTIEDWDSGKREPPEYVVRLIEYYLEHEGLIEPREFVDDQGDVLVIE